MCRKIFLEVLRFVYKLELRTLRLYYEIKYVELHRKNGLSIPSGCGLRICANAVPSTAVVPKRED